MKAPELKGLTKRCSEPRAALMRSFGVITTCSEQPPALSPAVAELVSR
jgi:hypothetical protein